MNCVCGETLLKPDASMLHCDSCDDWYTKGTFHTKSALGFQWLQVSQSNLQRVLLEAISIYETIIFQLSYLFGQWWCVAPHWYLYFQNVFLACLLQACIGGGCRSHINFMYSSQLPDSKAFVDLQALTINHIGLQVPSCMLRLITISYKSTEAVYLSLLQCIVKWSIGSQ